MILIISGTPEEAESWAYNAGYKRKEWRVVNSSVDIAEMGVRDHLVYAKGWQNRPDLAVLNAARRAREAT